MLTLSKENASNTSLEHFVIELATIQIPPYSV